MSIWISDEQRQHAGEIACFRNSEVKAQLKVFADRKKG
jgi:hypothetical protein